MRIPNAFWKHYDLHRRGIISIKEFALAAKLSENEIKKCLKIIENEKKADEKNAE